MDQCSVYFTSLYKSGRVPNQSCSNQCAHCPIKRDLLKHVQQATKMKGPSLNKNKQGPLVPQQYYTPTPTVLSSSVAFFFFLNVRVLFVPYCSEDFYTFNNIFTCQFSCQFIYFNVKEVNSAIMVKKERRERSILSFLTMMALLMQFKCENDNMS